MDTGMVFAMIFTIIIIGTILALGMNQIQQFFCFGSNAQAFKAVEDIESTVEEVFLLSRGSAKEYELSLPSDSKLCFVNKTNPEAHPYLDVKRTWNPDPLLIKQFLKNPDSPQYMSNLWLYHCGAPLGEGRTIRYLSPSKSFCSSKGDTLLLENKGSSVDISFLE